MTLTFDILRKPVMRNLVSKRAKTGEKGSDDLFFFWFLPQQLFIVESEIPVQNARDREGLRTKDKGHTAGTCVVHRPATCECALAEPTGGCNRRAYETDQSRLD